MGTRGLMGVVIDGEVKVSYNHFDSNPSGLGLDLTMQVGDMLKRWGLEKMRTQARKLVLVSKKIKPTAGQIDSLKGFSNLQVSNQTEDDWYCLLRELQGNMIDTLVVGYMIDDKDFAMDSLFCEWGYLINLDTEILEVYSGLQESPHDKGRFAKLGQSSEEYYPIGLIATFDLDNIPSDFANVCEFSSQDLYININDDEFTDASDVIYSLNVGESCIAYSVYEGNKEAVMKATRVGKEEIKIEEFEEEE